METDDGKVSEVEVGDTEVGDFLDSGAGVIEEQQKRAVAQREPTCLRKLLQLVIFDVVGRWLDESFADRRVEHHATMAEGDRVMVWYTQHGRHIGNGFPRLRNCVVAWAHVAWSQLHVFRVHEGKVVEHWAVRNDYRCSSRSTVRPSPAHQHRSGT